MHLDTYYILQYSYITIPRWKVSASFFKIFLKIMLSLVTVAVLYCQLHSNCIQLEGKYLYMIDTLASGKYLP